MTQFKSDLVKKILAGEKTQTRRPVKTGDFLGRRYTAAFDVSRDKAYTVAVHTAKGIVKWQEGKSYSIQPGRGKKGVGHFEVTQIRYEDVREISLADAKAEGFESEVDFLAVWCSFYDDAVHLTKLDNGRWSLLIANPGKRVDGSHVTVNIKSVSVEVVAKADQILELIKARRPDSLYQAWAISFRLVTAAVQS